MSLSTFPMLQPINRVQNFGRFHISYNPSSADYGCDTTALVLDDTVFLILNGSHQTAMKNAAADGGLPACIDYFVAHIGQANRLSEHHVINGSLKDLFGICNSAQNALGNELMARLRGAA